MNTIDISPFCKTKAQANEFMVRLAAINERVYETNFQLETLLQEQFGIQKKDSFFKLLRENNISSESPEAIKTFLTKLQEIVATLPVLSLTIAFEPKEETLKALADWFILNVKKQVLFNVSVDSSLIAGALISFQGRHANFSIKPQFEKILTTVITPPSSQTTETHTNSAPPSQHHQDIHDLHLGR